jgi:hypothetical protein
METTGQEKGDGIVVNGKEEFEGKGLGGQRESQRERELGFLACYRLHEEEVIYKERRQEREKTKLNS